MMYTVYKNSEVIETTESDDRILSIIKDFWNGYDKESKLVVKNEDEIICEINHF